MVQAAQAQIDQLFKLMDSFVNEDDYNVWNGINANIYKSLGWEPKANEPHLRSLLRNLVIRRLVSFEEQDVISEAKSRFEAYCKGGKELPLDLRRAVYRAIAAHCDDETFELFQFCCSTY